MLKPVTRWLIRWEVAWLLLLTPFLLFPTPTRALVLLVIPLLWILRWIAWGQIVPRTVLDWPLTILLFMIGVSVWATFDPLLSLSKVTGVLLGIAFYYALVGCVEWYKQLWVSLALLIATTCGIAGISLIGTTWANKFPIFERFTALLPAMIRGVEGSPAAGFNPNSVAGALLFALPLLLVMIWPFGKGALAELRGVLRWLVYLLLLAAFVMIGGTLLLTQSRGGYLGLLVGLGALALLPHKRLLILASVGLGMLLVVGIWLEPKLEYYLTIETAPGTALIGSWQGRYEIWSRAIEGIEDFALTGMGMGTFRHVVPVLYPIFLFSRDIGHAHNHLLAAGVDLGVPGLIAYLALWLGAGVMCWQVWHRTQRPDYRALILGLSAGMIAHFMWGVADANVLGSKAGFVFWLALAAIASLHRMIPTHSERPEKNEERPAPTPSPIA